jgi:hypothetical protein
MGIGTIGFLETLSLACHAPRRKCRGKKLPTASLKHL